MSTPEGLERRLEHKTASAKASPGALNDFPQDGGNQKQDSQHTSMKEGHGAPAAPKTHKEHFFFITFFLKKCVSTQKELERRSEHKPACANALHGALNEFLQKGSTQKQKSQHTRIYEGHSAALAPKNIKNMFLSVRAHQKS